MTTANLGHDLNAETNPDPLSGAPGSHPLGTGIGACAGGMVAGAAAGSIGGPLGTLIGALVGAIAGGFVGKGVAELFDPTAEEAFAQAAPSIPSAAATYVPRGSLVTV